MNSKFKPLMQPAFVVCIIVLAVACASKQAVIEFTGAKLKKEYIGLRKSFDLIDESAFKPYKVVEKSKIDNKDIVESLGTEDYIIWKLEDTEAGQYSPVRYCSLFITYYGMPDRVPHVPEECYVGSGNQQTGKKSFSLTINNDAADTDSAGIDIDIKHLLFEPTNTSVDKLSSEFSRMYFFRVNDGYANDRMGVREIMWSNVIGKHSFFSKVEWEFFGMGYGTYTRPKEEEIVKASEKLLSVVLPILENEHWPLWEEIGNE